MESFCVCCASVLEDVSVYPPPPLSVLPLNASVLAAHGPFPWHDGTGLHPFKEKQKAAFISELHY